MATSYSREQIVDLAMQMLGGGASLDDAIKAAADYGVDLASVYYSDPGTSFSASTPADTGSVDTGSVDTGPVDTGPIYSEPDNSGFEDVIVDPRSGSSGSGPVQSPLSTVSSGSVETGPVDTGPVSSEPAYTQKQYRDAGQFIAQNIDKPEVIAQVAQDLKLSTQDILTAVQTVNQDITKPDVENYLTKATSTVDTGPVDTGPVDTNVGSPLSTVSSSPVDTGPVDTREPYPGYFAQQEAHARSQSQISQNQQGFTDYQKSLSTPATITPNVNQTPYSPLDTASQIDQGETVVQSPVVVEKPVIKADPTPAEIAQQISAGILPVNLQYDVDRDGKVTSADALLLAKGTPVRSPLDLLKEAGSSLVTPALKPTADVTTTPSGQGDLPATGSAALKAAVAPGGIGVEEFDRRIREYLDKSPTEVEAYKRMLDLKASKEDIERATGKSYEQIFPETFKPGSVLSSGFGDVTKQLEGSGYYKGVAIPTFYEKSLGDDGWLSVADQLAQWKANIDKQDLSARAPFGFVETPIYSPGSGDSDPYLSGYQSTPATAFDYLTKNNPVIANAVLGPTSTAANAYKIVNGDLKEVGHDEITPEDLAEGNAFFMLAGATGGANRERMAQLYRAEGDELIPVGDPKMYQGAKETNTGLGFLDMVASALAFIPGPWQIPAAIYKAGRAIDEGNWAQAALAVIPVIGDVANAAAIASETAQVAGAVESASFANDIVNSVTNVIPSLDSVGKVTNALQQSVSALKAIDDKNWLGLVASGAGLAGMTGAIDANTAGLIRSTANLANVLNSGGSPAQIIAAATSLANNQGFVDRATTDQVNAVASIIAAKDNPAALMGAVAQAARSGVFNETAKIGAQYEQLNNRGVIDEYNVTGGGGALISSGNPAEDEQIALGQLNQAATSLVSDYVAAGGSMEPTDLRAALSKLTDPYGKPISSDTVERLVSSAESQLDTQTRNQKIQTDTLGVLADYTGRDSDLSRESAYERLVAAGNSGDRANEILAGVDAQVEANRAARAATQAQNQAAIKAGAGEFDGADARSAVAAGAGEFTGADAAAKANQRIQDQTTFANAFAVAREEFGPNATFNWNGKLYSTATAEERPDLTGKVDSTSQTTETPYVAPNGMHNRAAFIQAGGGTSDADYAKYVQAVNAVIAEGKSGTLITPASVNSTGKEMPSTTGPVTMEKPRVDSVLGSVAAQGVASFGANSIAGVLNSLGFTDAGKTVLDKANQIAAAATAAEGADITKGKADINAAIKKVGESSGIKDFAANVGNLASTAFNNPKAFGATVGSEVVEELLQFATLKFPASFLVKETVASALENAGAAYNNEYESQIAKGASKEDAHQAAQKAAGTAAGVSVALGGAAAGLGKVAGKVIGSQADEVPTSGVGQVGKTTLKESVQETIEEGSIAGAIDLALGRPIDAVNVLTNMTGGALYGGPTSGVMQATKLDTLDQTASTSIGSGLDADSISASIKSGASIDTTVKSALDAGADTTVVVGSAINSALDTGMSTGTVVSSTVGSAVSSGADSTIVIDSALSTVAQSGGDVSQAAGSAVTASLNAGANANETIIAATNSAIKNGGDVGSAVTTVIAGAVQGGASLSDASASSVATAIIGGANADTVIKAVTDSNSGVSVKADTGNNVTTVVASDATSNTKVVMDSNSQSVVTTTTDTNTGTTTQTTMQGNTTITTTTNQNTGISTTTKVDPNTTTNTTTDTNTGVTTQVTTNTNTNTNSTTTVNTNTNTTTNTTTNNNTNTTTNTSVNTDTGDAVITVVDDKTGEVIDTKVTTIDQLSTDVKETLKVDTTTGTTTDKTTTTKAPAVKAPAVTMPKAATAGAGMSLIGDIGRLPGTMLKTAGDPTLKDPLAALSQKVEEMNQIDPALLTVMAQRLGMQMPQAPQEPTFTYGQETSIDDILGLREPKAPEEEETAFAEGGFVEPLRAKAMNPQFMNHGGALPGGRENFKHGKHVAGEGDGQSDDIPAWLADGEFVFPADVVSALGNGSTKAGTDKLYKMMHEIRARARSTKVKDLPPPAHKSPLDYLKRGK